MWKRTHDAITAERFIKFERSRYNNSELTYIHHCIGPFTFPTISVNYTPTIGDNPESTDLICGSFFAH